ncbi:FXSXX-COOH protein [Streptomyces sp. 351MFTsu5.1]|uniref:FXSXX-COOH protein n=1 Tax=Streptomyces sp. 351MFTsu5.1 TaxID=1172180 RepID=UPI0003A3CB0D|nr:FXSXX-COOH protein [Streptomyces sp. 351MFTsu5.1]
MSTPPTPAPTAPRTPLPRLAARSSAGSPLLARVVRRGPEEGPRPVAVAAFQSAV